MSRSTAFSTTAQLFYVYEEKAETKFKLLRIIAEVELCVILYAEWECGPVV